MNDIVPGSLGAITAQNNKTLAESFASADCVVIVDTSGSMNSHDSRDDKSRYEVACEELAQLQLALPGKIAVIGFSDSTEFFPGGLPRMMGCSTNMAGALKFVKVADVPGMKFILISDGEPDDPKSTLDIAKTFTTHIDVIYVGPEQIPTGRDFLERLAKLTGGKSVTADCAKSLAANVEKLMLGA